MADWNITLIEYHSHGEGIQLFPDVFTRASEPASDETEDAADEVEDDTRSAPKGIAILLVLALLIGIAYVARQRRNDDEDETIVESEPVEVTEYED